MTKTRAFSKTDIPALEKAIKRDTFHPGEWKVEHFTYPYVASQVIEDDKGPIVFVRFTKSLRISVVWNDAADTSRNSRAIIFGIKDAVEKARASGFTEIIITTGHPKLQVFLTKVMKMNRSGDEYLLAV